MTAETNSVPYEAPAIEERTRIDVPLAGGPSSSRSAVFRPSVAYEPPAIEERTPIGLPLNGIGASGGGGSAAFRPAPRD